MELAITPRRRFVINVLPNASDDECALLAEYDNRADDAYVRMKNSGCNRAAYVRYRDDYFRNKKLAEELRHQIAMR